MKKKPTEKIEPQEVWTCSLCGYCPPADHETLRELAHLKHRLVDLIRIGKTVGGDQAEWLYHELDYLI